MAAPSWEPSLGFGIGRETPTDAEPSDTGLPWDRAPADSHLWGFRFYDARKFSFLRRFGPDVTRGMSQLQVRFKDARGNPRSEYVYFFSDHDAGAGFFARMAAAASPGEVVRDLIAAGIPYQKQGQFS